MAVEDEILPIPNLRVAQYNFTLSNPRLVHLHEEGAANLLKAIEADGVLLFLPSWTTGDPSTRCRRA